jgi:hypothetical protein
MQTGDLASPLIYPATSRRSGNDQSARRADRLSRIFGAVAGRKSAFKLPRPIDQTEKSPHIPLHD